MTDATKNHVGATLEGMLGIDLKFEELYNLEKRLRSGSYGTVYVTKHRLSNEEYAVKIIDRKKLKKKSDDEGVFREVAVLRELSKDISGIVRLIDFFVSPDTFYMVQVYAKGGDVFDRLTHRTTYTEADAAKLAQRLIETLGAMHERGYVHRDIKPENLLLEDPVDDTSILLADFGFAKRLPENGLKTRCGTPAFVAPEILVGSRYTATVDLWSTGVILFLLIGGYPPFQDQSHKGLFRKIRAADYIFHETYWEKVSLEAKQLISSLLVVNPRHRWTAKECLDKSAWLRSSEETLSLRNLHPNLAELKKFNARRKLRSAIHAVHWMTHATFWNPDQVSFAQQMTAWEEEVEQNGNDAASSVATPVARTVASTVKTRPVGFRDIYELKSKIRKGSFATVWECLHKDTQEIYAVKIIKREGLKPSDDEQVMNEVAILQSMAHENIVQLVDFYEEKDYFFLVMDYLAGGDVFDRIVERTVYTEKDARDLCIKLLRAVKFMHQHGVAHRDLKPQNLLLSSKEDDADIKVADFGFARRVHTPQSLTTRCGTPTYVAPEILKNIPHDTAADMWSVGVIVYVLLVGYPPFMEDNQQELFRKIRSGSYDFPDEDWKNISKEAQELISGLLVVDPLQRWTASEAIRCKWIQLDGTSLSSRDLTESLVIMKQKRQRLRSIATTLQWLTRDPKEHPVPANVHHNQTGDTTVSEMEIMDASEFARDHSMC
mmetsp:Transcript_31837/g.47310  ORF Transcript_31837/g.47310 Transcript_31837/m.47310 type:complete len:718 (-) Transcript_31837:710-2863(-)|eukprot:CAMPEP_0194071590 /NCGR_PEP_ID=MMETSP0009_2-20130614/88786_1 /TAXON_ID=210454 /ORGANISM="Grammatophora oceanica, Strain CCMP 410" /LENGTH=717 /DNA_ID=CAMNT_0038724921 /DNA_START=52 /DNA_END=2205 /DNA_ORIENTATION=-